MELGAGFGTLTLLGFMLLGFVRGPSWLRWLGIALTALIALVSGASAITLYRVGSEHHWTGDGPGMLVVMLGVALSAPFTLVAAGTVVVQLRAARAGSGRRAPSPRLALGLIALGMTGSVASAVDYRLTSTPSHDAPVIALGFTEDGARLFSLDRAGTLKSWRVGAREHEATRHDPALADARRLLVTADGRQALVLVSQGAYVLSLTDVGAPALDVPDVTRAALLPGGEVALAYGTEVRIVSLAALRATLRAHTLPSPVSALAADRRGQLAVALEDGSVVVLDRSERGARTLAQLPAPARCLAFSPRGTWIVTSAQDGRGHVIDTRHGGVRSLADFPHLYRFAFVSDDVLVLNTAENDPAALALSLARLDTHPWLSYGHAITALAGGDGAPESALAMAGEVYLARAPISGNAYTSTAERLVDRRF